MNGYMREQYVADTFNQETFENDNFQTKCYIIRMVLGIEEYELTDVIESFLNDDLFFDNDYKYINGYDLVYYFNKEQLLVVLDEIEDHFGNEDFKLMKKDINHYHYIMDKLNVLEKE